MALTVLNFMAGVVHRAFRRTGWTRGWRWAARGFQYTQSRRSCRTHHTPLISHHSSYTTHLTPLITHHSPHTTHHTPLILHNSSHTTHLTPLISHRSSHTTRHTPRITHHSSHTPPLTTHHTPLITHHYCHEISNRCACHEVCTTGSRGPAATT